jgi:vacuolar iron transporter family protein
VLGIILGIAAASSDIRLIFVAGLAALGAESISMGAVAYTSTLARQRQYFKEVKSEKSEMKSVPQHNKNEVRQILKGWGYTGSRLERLTKELISNPKAALNFLVSFERKISPVDKSAPMRSFMVVLTATVAGSVVPLIPFIFTRSIELGAVSSVILCGAVLFMIGYYAAKKTVGSLWRSGLQLLIIGLAAGFAGYLIGHFVGAIPI